MKKVGYVEPNAYFKGFGGAKKKATKTASKPVKKKSK